MGTLRVGWIAAGTLHGSTVNFRSVPRPFPAMRISDNARWMHRTSDRVRNEIYRRGGRYDVVVFVKAMDERCQLEVEAIRRVGGRIVFDANVNYYEIWGEYDIDGTRPTPEQQRDATAMTAVADWVVADSTYLLSVIRGINERASWIPDNVDVRLYRPGGTAAPRRPLRLVWSGVAKKARHLTLIVDVLRSLNDVELVLVTDDVPDVLPDLQAAVPCRLVRWSERRYARVLRDSDVIISPKRLLNGYEFGHTEYKITLGMAAGLPAVASPQPSYVDAIQHAGGGVICETHDEWHDALQRLADPAVRRELGVRARRTVLERYTTAVTATQYHDLLCSLA